MTCDQNMINKYPNMSKRNRLNTFPQYILNLHTNCLDLCPNLLNLYIKYYYNVYVNTCRLRHYNASLSVFWSFRDVSGKGGLERIFYMLLKIHDEIEKVDDTEALRIQVRC